MLRFLLGRRFILRGREDSREPERPPVFNPVTKSVKTLYADGVPTGVHRVYTGRLGSGYTY